MKRCLIVVDYQQDFVTGALGFAEAVRLERPLAQKIKQYRENGDAVMFTFDTHGSDYSESFEGRRFPTVHAVEGTEGHRLFGLVGEARAESDRVFYKHTYGSDTLYAHLKEMAYESIELAGVVTNICVLANAVLAKTAQPETEILVDASCVASDDPRLQEAALQVMESLQITVLRKGDGENETEKNGQGSNRREGEREADSGQENKGERKGENGNE